jgi:long-subunit fatty acid transport protein
MCRETANYRLGAEVIVPQIGTKLMGGYYYQSSPFKPSVESVKSDRQYVSVGASFLLDKQVKIDFAYQRGWWNQSTTDNFLGKDDNDVPLATREKITTNKFLVNFSYRF